MVSEQSFNHQQQSKIDFVIFSAMNEELEFVEKNFNKDALELIKAGDFEFKMYEHHYKKILLAQTGLGTTFAASIVTLVYQCFRPDYAFFLGTAGGIKPGLMLRDVIVVEKAFEAEIQGVFKAVEGTPFSSCLVHPLKKQTFPSVYSADPELLSAANDIDVSGVRIHKGTAVSSNTFPAPLELFEKIKSVNPHCIDMETSAFYQVAWLFKIPALAVRGVSNVLCHDGTDENIHESDVKGSSEAAGKVVLKIIDKLLLKFQSSKTKQLASVKESKKIIKCFNLQPHPEGGYYLRSFESLAEVKSTDKDRYNNEKRTAGTAIYYLLEEADFSAWHCLKSDEIWHYYKGSSVYIHVIDGQGALNTYLLGDPLIHEGARFQIAIKAGEWFAAEITNKKSYSFLGCTVSPGFEFKDFKLANRVELTHKFPQHAVIIDKFTRIASEEIKKTEEIRLSPVRLLSRL